MSSWVFVKACQGNAKKSALASFRLGFGVKILCGPAPTAESVLQSFGTEFEILFDGKYTTWPTVSDCIFDVKFYAADFPKTQFARGRPRCVFPPKQNFKFCSKTFCSWAAQYFDSKTQSENLT
jgi:hypothetical protein